MRRIIAILLISVYLSLFASSATIIEYNETDLVNLKPQAHDNDQDKLTYFFGKPLSTDGEWQTDYGDAGTYDTKVTVSDGRLTTSENITLIINKKEMAPSLNLISPKNSPVEIAEGQNAYFKIEASDLNKDNLSFTWIIDGEQVSESPSYLYSADYYSQGNHTLKVIVSDGTLATIHDWEISVKDFDRLELLSGFTDINVNESDSIKLAIPDFAKFGLKYNISYPLENGIWQTNYNDSGVYKVHVKIWDNKTFSAEALFTVRVFDVDQPPVYIGVRNFIVNEDEEITIPINFVDPDYDAVKVDAFNLPMGAKIENQSIVWQPDFDAVTKENFMDSVEEKYNIMNKKYYIDINASSRNITSYDKIIIRVMNTDRAPALNDIPDVTVYEGEEVNLNISAVDPDGDDIVYKFEGIIDKIPYKTQIGDAGTYQVKVIAFDGYTSSSKFAKVNVIARQILDIMDLNPISIKENDELVVPIIVKTSDNEEVIVKSDALPKGAYITGSKLYWKPGYDTVGNEAKNFSIPITAVSGKLNSTKYMIITIENNEIAPQIATSSQIAEGYVGDEIELSVEIFNPEGIPLNYQWNSGQVSSTVGNKFKIVFDSAGIKHVTVNIAAGKYSLTKKWDIKILDKPKVKLIYP